MTTSAHPVATQDGFLSDALAGLRAKKKYIPGKYLWDERGSSLFDQTCQTQGYYPAWREVHLLEQTVSDIANIVGPKAQIVEMGSGASKKVRILLDNFQSPQSYVAIDISDEFMRAAAARIEAAYPNINVSCVCADFMLPLPALPIVGSGEVLGFFPGASIGNMEAEGAVGLLTRLRQALGKSWLLIGQDLNTDPGKFREAYGNQLMSALHKNILTRLQDELGAKLSPDEFRHEIKISDPPCRIEAHLVATRATEIAISDRSFFFSPGESICTDISRKYTRQQFEELHFQAGWRLAHHWTDADKAFGLYLFRASE